MEQARVSFAQRIQERGVIKSASLIRGLATVPREHFVGPGPWKIIRPADIAKGYQLTPDDNPSHLYDNVLVALDAERLLNNGEPLSLLLFLDSLDLAPGDRFLHIGCGVGYYTAIAAEALNALWRPSTARSRACSFLSGSSNRILAPASPRGSQLSRRQSASSPVP